MKNLKEKKGNEQVFGNIRVKGGFMKVVKQCDLRDCGVCSLQSIILYYKGYVPLEKLRLDTYTTKDGTNALNLVNAAKKYGFDSYGTRATAKDLFSKNFVLPAIAHLTLENGVNHFVVIYKISSNKLVIMDPAKGKVIMKKSDFLKVWTNIILFFHPREKILTYTKETPLSNLFLNIFKNQKKLIIKLIWVSICLTVLSIISNYYFKVGLNAITENIFINSLTYIILLFAFATIFKVLFQYLRNYFENHLNKNIDIHVFSNFITHIFNLPSNIIQSRSVGEVVTRVTELNDLKILFTDFFITIFLDSILALSSMVLLFVISKEMFFILCFSLILYLLIGLIFNKINYNKIRLNIESETDFNTTLIENLNMFTSIKNLNTVDLNLSQIENKLMNYLKNNYTLAKFLNYQVMYKSFINEVSIFLINTIGFYLIKIGELNVVDLITFNSLMSYYLDPIRNTIDMLPKLNYLKASFYKINDFLSNKIENLGDENKLLNNSITFNNVSFSYNSYNYILKDFNAFINSNEHVFLKGNSGTGKSTICKILYKLVNEYKGNILIGGVSISDYSLSSIRSCINYVSQNEEIFSDTIRNNITFFRNIELSEFNKVCNICKLESLVSKRPLRYDSLINPDTNNLSGGEKQRIILARALLKKSNILILDEALSEVDYDLEKEIIKNILDNFKDKTIIYISHKNHESLFDKIINLENLNASL